jgi:hypothetical protein
MNKKIRFLLLLTSLQISIAFAQPIKKNTPIKLATKAIITVPYRTLDTLLLPIGAGTEMYHKDIIKLIKRLDYLDGKEDNEVKNYLNENDDAFINKYILQATQHARFYIENETFDKSTATNFYIKKKYLAQIKDNVQQFLTNLKKQQFPLDSFKNMMIRTEDLAEATKLGTFSGFTNAHLDIATYFNKNLFANDAAITDALMNELCMTNPQMLGSNLKALKKYKNMCNVFNYLAINKSNEILNYITSTSVEKDIILECPNALIQYMNELATKTSKPLRTIAMLGAYQRKEITIDQMNAIANNDHLYFQELIKLHQSKELICRNVIERDLKLMALDFTRTMNELHESNENTRFKCLENLSIEELYYIIIFGNAEIYTSSYLGTYKRLMTRLQPKTGYDLIEIIQRDKFRTFIRMCANFNTLENFLTTMSKEQKYQLMNAFVSKLGEKQTVFLEEAVNVADSFGSITDPELLQYLKQQTTQQYNEYVAARNEKVGNIYKILKTLFLNDGKDSISNDTKNELKLPSINVVNSNQLHWDTVNTVYEQMFFYGDDDGKVGYQSFLGTFSPSQWKVDVSSPEWTVISSLKTKTPLVIYANKPLDEPNDEYAQMHLLDYLIEKDIHPTIMVHRGHSYHLKGTIQALNYENKIVILGSCGGYQNLSEILQRCPDAHIVSTKQVGAFRVNTPIINAVNSCVTSNKDIDWVAMWKVLSKQFKGTNAEDLFNDYVPPHKNLGSLFLKAYNKLNAEPE